MAQGEAEEPYFSRNEPKLGEVVAPHTLGGDDNNEREGESILMLILKFYAYLLFLFKLGTHPYNQQ